jgi:hypothetical protein
VVVVGYVIRDENGVAAEFKHIATSRKGSIDQVAKQLINATRQLLDTAGAIAPESIFRQTSKASDVGE